LVPLSVIAGMLFVMGAELIEGRLPDARLALASSWGSVAAGLVTFLSALFIPLQWTIFLGAGLSMILYIYDSATHVRLLHLVRTNDGKFETGDVPEVYPSNQATVVVFEGNKFFAEVPLYDELLPSHQDVKNAVVILRARYQESVSSTALKWVERYAKDLRQSGNLLMLAGVEAHVMQKLEKAGLLDRIGRGNVFASGSVLENSLHAALDAAEEWIKKKT
jgi:SulP family sulfate permease